MADITKNNEDDIKAVARLLNRAPQGEFSVVLRSANGEPRVIKNIPLLYDGTPMPTLYWLVGTEDCKLVARLESQGGVRQAESEVSKIALKRAHHRYQKERDRLIPKDHLGNIPRGGVGGTQRGVKCLHAHYAWYLVGGRDPVGKWVHKHLKTTIESPK